MSDSHGPIWIVNAPAQDYPDERFDGVTTIPPLNPNQPTPEVCDACGQTATNAYHYHDGIGGCEFCCPICRDERIADAAREALDNIETVLMHWTFHFISDMAKLRALRDLLKPPAPAWQAKEENE